jgi:hypothetical protein
VAARLTHNQQVAGSSPVPATMGRIVIDELEIDIDVAQCVAALNSLADLLEHNHELMGQMLIARARRTCGLVPYPDAIDVDEHHPRPALPTWAGE